MSHINKDAKFLTAAERWLAYLFLTAVLLLIFGRPIFGQSPTGKPRFFSGEVVEEIGIDRKRAHGEKFTVKVDGNTVTVKSQTGRYDLSCKIDGESHEPDRRLNTDFGWFLFLPTMVCIVPDYTTERCVTIRMLIDAK